MPVRVELALPSLWRGFSGFIAVRLTCWIFKHFIALSVYFHTNDYGKRGLETAVGNWIFCFEWRD